MGLRTFTFGGTASSTYSMFITEAATYNVPERAVEMLEIPGRNGAYALDQGRFENVEVTYHVVVHKDTNANFQTELSNVRNWLASKVGYQRLTDDYNSNVYRMAIFKGGLETDEAFVNGAEFDIVFECKPQRWLTSGETATAVANNGTLSNPTLFDSEPLLAVKGYGGISFNGYDISIENILIGDVLIWNESETTNNAQTITFARDMTVYNSFSSGDTFTVDGKQIIATVKQYYSYPITACTINSTTNCTASFSITNGDLVVTIDVPSLTFAIGTTSSATNSVVDFTFTCNGSTYNRTITVKTRWNDENKKMIHSVEWSSYGIFTTPTTTKLPDVWGNSTKSALGNPTYIDCDIGECYMVSGSEIVSLNGVIDLGSDLPILSPGTNTFTYDNTITELKVTPRWWKV